MYIAWSAAPSALLFWKLGLVGLHLQTQLHSETPTSKPLYPGTSIEWDLDPTSASWIHIYVLEASVPLSIKQG